MAELEELIDIVDESLGEDTEGIEDLPEEVQEEIEADVAEAREEVSQFSEVAETLKSFLDTISWRGIVKFLGKNGAIAVIFWGINAALSKICHHQSSKDIEKKKRVIKAIASLIKTETDMGQKTLAWMKEHQGDTIKLEDYEVPLESVIETRIRPISEVWQHHCTLKKSRVNQPCSLRLLCAVGIRRTVFGTTETEFAVTVGGKRKQ